MSSLVESQNYLPLGGPAMGNGQLVQSPDMMEAESHTNFLAIAWRSRWLLLLCMLLGIGIAWGLLQRVTPLYQSVSRIYIERSLRQLLGSDYQTGQSANYLNTQADLIRSSSVLAAVANAPENRDLESFRGVENPVGFLFEHIEVHVSNNSDIINISAELPNAEDAATLVNSVVDAYISKYAEQRRTNVVEVLNILRKEKNHRDTILQDQRDALKEFRQLHPELAVRIDKENVVTNQFSVLADELNKTEIALIDAKARYHRIKKMYETPALRSLLLSSAGAQEVMQGVRRETQIQMALTNQSQDLELRLTNERARWGEGHPRVRLLKETLDTLNKRILQQEQKVQKQEQEAILAYVDSARQELELLESKRDELQASYDTQFEKAKKTSSYAIQMVALEDELARTEKLSDILDDRIKQVNLTEEVGVMKVSIMDAAVPSRVKSYPVPSKFMMIGCLLGGLCGFGLAWLRDLLDHRMKSIDEITSAMQLPVLGIIPLQGGEHNRLHVGRITEELPTSTIAEAIRTLRTALHFGMASDDGEEVRTIAITSPSPGDGKSIVASNLAIALAQGNQRVLLIDADMRKPRQHEIFLQPNKLGLGNILAERLPFAEAIVTDVADSLDLLPSGSYNSNPVELLNNGYFADLLEQLSQHYDKIIIDSPPVMPVADARVIGALSDSVILVLRAERSTRRTSIAARNELWQVRAKRLGMVINCVPTKRSSAYGYGYGYSDYGYGDYTQDRIKPRTLTNESNVNLEEELVQNN